MTFPPGIRAAMIGGALILLMTGCGRETASEPERTDRGTAIAVMGMEPRDMSRRVMVSGPVEPRVHIRLASRTHGTVHRLHKEEGDRVRAGELLAELDMSEQQAELGRANAEEERARLDYERMAELRQRGAVSLSEYQQAQATLRVAESERELWRARVAFGRITAPQDGVVTQRHIEPGEAVQQHETLFELAAMDELVVRPGLPEVDVVHLMPGQLVTVRLDALRDEIFAGTVRRIFPAADTGSRLVTVEVALPEGADERGVRPGYLARLQFDVDARTEVLALPTPSVGADTEADGYYVYLVEDNELKRREVSIGINRGGWTEITSGLEPGDVVLASNPIDMRDGQRVRIVERRN
ncbi:efflux RND transporter periplasmic adaptor subunit [Marinimicrobium sp. ABcell2]|uniref:efflux RND transporter periplasmic adaptor subunit n=1 Tax=Marinimicrobium sp. ABcell2 TaxID=3069751 RepID=UPI0027B1430B|nr:efflux RND transporter periplasmic adaptor subunit [Marinimicrobium sp. ABcell2]MDQ2076106.1 efflux RND transporter periplasmic adaptor subunit [Marinimicrobium sp. ABcell2]